MATQLTSTITGGNILASAFMQYGLGTGSKPNVPAANVKNPAAQYEYGQAGRTGRDTDGDGFREVDCSALVYNALRNAGYAMPGVVPTSGAINFTTSTLFSGQKLTETATKNFDEVKDASSYIPGDIMLFAPKGGAQHMGIYYGQDADNRPIFYGSQTSTGPAVFSMAPLSPKEPAYFNTDNLVGVLRPKPELYVPEMDLTGGAGTGLSSGHVMAAVNLLKSSSVEGYRPHIYSDNEQGRGDGVPTVGNGFTLVVKGTNGWTIRPENEIKDLLRDAGLPESRYSELPMEKLQQSANLLNKGDMLGARNVFGTGQSDTGFGLSEADADKLSGSFVIREVIPRTLKAVGGAENFAEFSDGEFAAVASKTYQSPGWLNSPNGKNFLQAWSRGDDETAQALLGSGQRGKAEAQAYTGHIDSVNPNLNVADGNSPSAVSTNGHWEDTTQFDQQGNVTVTGERVWVSDRNKVDDSKTVNADESARPSSSSKELLVASKQIELPAGDSVDADLPDGTRVVSTSTTFNGQTTVTAQLIDKAGQVLLNAGAGQTMERDPDTGIVQVRTGTSDHVQQYDPATGEVSQAFRTGSDADFFYQNLLDAFSNPQISAGEGEQLVDASGGLPEASKQAMGGVFSNYLENQGVSQISQAQASALFNSLMASNNWDHLSDVGKLSALVNLYNATDKLGGVFGATGNNLPGDLGAAAGYLQLLQGLQSGDDLVITNSINVLSDHALDNAMNQAFGTTAAGEAVPYLSYALAIRNFADNPEQAMLTGAGTYFGEAFGAALGGPMGAAIGGALGGVVGGMFGGMFGGGSPPPPEGVVHFSWDDKGHIQHTMDFNQSGGGVAASNVAAGVQTMLQNLVDAHNAQNPGTADDIAINPYLLPRMGFSNSSAWMEVVLPDGATVREGIHQESFAQRLLVLLQDNGGIAPAWQVQTQQMHYQQALQEGQSQEQAEAPLRLGAGGQPFAGTSAFSLQGNAVEGADFKSQTFGALVVHLNDNPNVQTAQTQLTQVLRDVENDGYFEQTQAVAHKDSAGNFQAVLTIDFNGDGIVQTRDILNLGGNSSQGNLTDEARLANQNADQQRNNVQWLDANSDGVLDKRDPAFAAIRLWVDVNQDGVQPGDEASSLGVMHIISINFKTGEVTYEDGHTDALSAQTLKADTEGVKLTQINEINPDGTLHTLDGGTVLEHEGYQGKVQITDEGGTRWVDKRDQCYEQQAKRTGDWEGTAEQEAHRHGGGNIEGAPTQTTATGATDFGPVKTQANPNTQSTVTVDSARVVSDMAGQVQQSQTNAQTTIAAGDIRIRSNAAPTTSPTSSTSRPTDTRIVFVPSAQTSAQSEIRIVTEGMIESSKNLLFGGGSASLGVLTAVGAGATASAATAAEMAQRPLVVSEVRNSNASAASPLVTPPVTGNLFTTTTSSSVNTEFNLPSVTFKQVDLGVFSVPQVVQVATPSSPLQNSAATSIPYVSTEPPSPVFVPATVILKDSATAATGKSSATVATISEPTPVQSAQAASTVINAPSLGYPVVQAETLPGTEDLVLRLNQSVLLANDSTPNASADPTQSALTITAVSAPLNGQVSLVNGEVLFAPDTNFHGNASFTYTVTDQYGLSTNGNATLLIAAVNDAPVTQGESYASDEDIRLVFTQAVLLANDIDVDVATDAQVLRISRVGDAQHGTVTLDARGQVRFVPDLNYHGPAQFTYWVSDGLAVNGAGAEIPATVKLTISAVNDVPMVVGEALATNEDTPLFIPAAALLANDGDVDVATDGQVLSLSAVSAIAGQTHGVVSLVTQADGTQQVQFTPDLNYHGVAKFIYTVSDGNGGFATATATSNVASVNDAPVTQGESYTSPEDTDIFLTQAQLLDNDSDVDVATDGQVLTISAVSSAKNGTVTLLANGDIRFTPSANYHGPAEFTYTVSDGPVSEGAGAITNAIVHLTITAINDVPIAVGDVFTTAEDITTVLTPQDLLGNDSDNDIATVADVLSITRVFAPQHCTVVLNADGTISLSPEANYHGNVRFSYEITDAQGATSVAFVVAGVNAVNDAPVAYADTFTSTEDTIVILNQADLLDNDTDNDMASDGDALLVSAVRNATHGTVRLMSNGQIKFVPERNFHGIASFDYVVSDSFGATSLRTVTLLVGAVNDFPVVINEADATTEDMLYATTANALLANDSDVDTASDSQVLTISQVQNAQHGVVAMDMNGRITFTPDANFHGTASFEYVVSDGTGVDAGGLRTGTVTLTVLAVNDAPVSQGESYASPEDTDIVFTQAQLLDNDSDVDVATDGQVLTISAVSSAKNGTVTLLANGDIRFTPSVNYHGPAEFTYTVSDGNGANTDAKVNLTISAVNDVPIAVGETIAATEDTPFYIEASALLADDSDVDVATDGQVLSLSAVSTIAGQTHGTVSLVTQADGTQRVQFTPDLNFHGVAKFNYTVSDGNDGFVTVVATVNLTAVNDAPVTQGETATTLEDTAIVFTQAELLANDSDVDIVSDGQELRISAVSGATNGMVSMLANGDIRFTPNLNFHGPAQFTYTVSDGNGGMIDAIVDLTITAVNDAPVAQGEAIAATEDTPFYIEASALLANDSDVDLATDGQVLSLSAVSSIAGQTHGTVSLVTQLDGTQQVQFTPDTNDHGVAKFNYTVSDGNGGFATAMATVNIAAVNDAPVTQGLSYSSDEDMGLIFTQAQLLANVTDVDMATDGQVLRISRVGQAEHGTVWLDAQGNLRFVPDANYHGPARFTYWVSDGDAADGAGAETPATMNLIIVAVNDIPVVQGESTHTTEDTRLTIDAVKLLANDSDPDVTTDGQVLSISGLSKATYCTVSLVTETDGRQYITFVPQANFHGTATFDYTVTDVNGGSVTATAVVNLSAVNDAPVTTGEIATGDEDNTLVFSSNDLLIDDTDVDVATDGQMLRISLVGSATHGTVTLDAQGQVRFTPDANYHGPAQFTYWVSDGLAANGAGAEVPATVLLTILAVNDLPVVTGETINTNEDTTLLFNPTNLLANDTDVDLATDGQVLSITAVSNATHGTVSFVTQPDGSQRIAFTPEPNYFGFASYQYTVSDGAGGNSVGTVLVNLAQVNDVPVAVNDTIGNALEDTELHISLASLLANDTDADGHNSRWGGTDDVLTVTAVGNAEHGRVALVNGEVVFTPDANYNGPASFAYLVSDSSGGVSQALTTFYVTAVNDAPVALGETIFENEDTTLVISQAALLQNDSDVDNARTDLVISRVQSSTGGSVTLNASGNVVFTPTANYNGTATFTYWAKDPSGLESNAVITTVVLAPVNDAPMATGETITSNEDEVLTITAGALLQNDSDVDDARADLIISRVQSGTGCFVTLNASGNVVFTPTANYNGTATFTYWVKDPSGLESNAVTTTVVLTSVNDAPIAHGELVAGAKEDAVFNIEASTLLANDFDVDDPDSALRLSWVGNPTGGSVNLDANGNVVFTPAMNFFGTATFQYKVCDAAGLESGVVVAVVPVEPVNDIPVAVDDHFATYKNSTMLIDFGQLTSNDTDVDSNPITVSSVRDHANGRATIVNGQVQFVANTGFTGAASFDYLADDGHGGQTWATAYVDVKQPPNLYPMLEVRKEFAHSAPTWIGYPVIYSAGNYLDKLIIEININDDSLGPVNIELISAQKYSFFGINASAANISKWGWVDGVGGVSYELSKNLITFSTSSDFERGFNQYQTVWKVTDEFGLSNIWHYNQISYLNYQLTSESFCERNGYFIAPVIFDLNADGVHFTSLQNSQFKMDVNLDGIQDKMAWAGNDDGVLVWDKDHNHQITDASEFGFQTLKAGAQTDLEGLQALDTNGNGLLDEGDAKFAEFAVWQDANGNGANDDGEFKTLTELSIAHISLHSDGQMRDAGTLLTHSSIGETDATVMGNASLTRVDGTTGVVADAMLAYEAGHALQSAPQAASASDAAAQTAEIIRQALLFNQACNTAIAIDATPLGYVPIQPDIQCHDMFFATQEGSHQIPHSA